ncbi:phosphoheptose isomerase [Paramagnetospirillum caucaseum]|uniref:Phosphoheptose isomerase n=1 Tax=Paramagnetospirillum caucaseum TaxID=1244869 RepID=M2ZPA6_9PROT|nr:SIS domain-containing protein [Paramagnetospirillum caucaseum]EME69122.1 phosphoheptose isomerase [Paramagnetospirillum caucaseum]
MSFPERRVGSIADYFDAYAGQISQALASVGRDALHQAERLLSAALERDAHIFSCGNGGSAAIANHLVCDHTKGVSTDTGLRPRVFSLSTTVETITAIANDIEYAEVFAAQLRLLARPGDVVIAISSSGDSENIVRALDWARANGMGSIALTGFSGGRGAKAADVNLHVAADNYGVVEDVHQTLMHVLAQFVRQARMPDSLVAQRRF